MLDEHILLNAKSDVINDECSRSSEGTWIRQAGFHVAEF